MPKIQQGAGGGGSAFASQSGNRIANVARYSRKKASDHLPAFTGGESAVDYLFAFTVELFLTTKRGDAQLVTVSGQCAAAALKPPLKESEPPSLDQVRIAFDSDAVLFDDASELPILFPTRLISPFCSFA
jgi:5'-nucleotidase